MFLIRVDGSAQIGFGHLSRCAYLAQNHFPGKTLFLVREKESISFLNERKISYLNGNNQTFDLKDFRAVIFDLDKFSEEDKSLLRQSHLLNLKTVQITDLGLDQQKADLIIDSSLEQIYPYSQEQKVALGPEYAILHHRFRHFNKIQRKYGKKIKKIFLCLGGGSDYRKLHDISAAFYRQGFQLKIAAGFSIKANIRKKMLRKFPGIRFCGKTDSLARSMFEADLAIICSGIAGFEAASAGTPALYLWHHQLQEFQASSFEKKGWGKKFCGLQTLKPDELVEYVKRIDYLSFIEYGLRAKREVDGLGAIRVKEKIFEEVFDEKH